MRKAAIAILGISFVGLSIPTLAQAQIKFPEGSYAEFRAGASFRDDADNDGSVNGSTDFDPGTSLGAAIGYSFGRGDNFGLPFLNGFRLEVEYLRQENDVNDIGFVSVGNGPGDSANEIELNAFMFNVYYDHDTGTAWTPYIGGGVGAAIVDFEASSGGNSVVDDSDTVLAFQARTGIGYEISPSVVLSVGYRFFGTDDPQFNVTNGGQFDSEYFSHTAEAGLRVYF